jgi:hypothetical protein
MGLWSQLQIWNQTAHGQAATAAAWAFWTKVLDALGVEADPAFQAMDPSFTAPLCVGRPLISESAR